MVWGNSYIQKYKLPNYHRQLLLGINDLLLKCTTCSNTPRWTRTAMHPTLKLTKKSSLRAVQMRSKTWEKDKNKPESAWLWYFARTVDVLLFFPCLIILQGRTYSIEASPLINLNFIWTYTMLTFFSFFGIVKYAYFHFTIHEYSLWQNLEVSNRRDPCGS